MILKIIMNKKSLLFVAITSGFIEDHPFDE